MSLVNSISSWELSSMFVVFDEEIRKNSRNQIARRIDITAICLDELGRTDLKELIK